MEKYIIDLNKDWIDGEYLRLPARIAGTLQWIKTKTALIPYTEDSVYAHGYTEAESKYREIRDELEKQAYQRGYETAKHECEDCQKIRADAEQELVKKAYDTAYADAEEIYESGKRAMYQKGLKDAWEAARKIVLDEWDNGIKYDDFYELFNEKTCKEVLKTYTASEAIEKLKAYEQKQEEQIRVGDEVIAPMGVAVITKISDECFHFIHEDGTYGFDYKKDAPRKTGRHFPEIAEVLQKMKENNDNK